MSLKTVTYTSLASLDLTASDLIEIHQTARRLNALDGITGLLIFNGSRFLQIVEGAEDAIDDLLDRLRRDDRHSALEIRDSRFVDDRAFPDWSMEMAQVSALYLRASEEIAAFLPPDVPAEVTALIQRMAKSMATPLNMPD